jgi:hypothetical protein
MIARIQTRTCPIPFDASTAAGASAHPPRAINWSGGGNPAAPRLASTEPGAGQKVRLAGHLPLSAQGGVAPTLQPGLGAQAANMPRLSPVKAALPFSAPTPTPIAAPSSTGGHPHTGSVARNAGASARVAGSTGHKTLTDITARFTGQGSLSVRSSVTGRHYRFQGHGDCLVIDKSDMVLLRRITDLEIG